MCLVFAVRTCFPAPTFSSALKEKRGVNNINQCLTYLNTSMVYVLFANKSPTMTHEMWKRKFLFFDDVEIVCM